MTSPGMEHIHLRPCPPVIGGNRHAQAGIMISLRNRKFVLLGRIGPACRHEIAVGRPSQRDLAHFLPFRHLTVLAPCLALIRAASQICPRRSHRPVRQPSFPDEVPARLPHAIDLPCSRIPVHPERVPLIPRFSIGHRRLRYRLAPRLAVVFAEEPASFLRAEDEFALPQIRQPDRDMVLRVIRPIQYAARITPRRPVVIARHDHRPKGKIPGHQHEQSILLRHIDQIRDANDPMPSLGDNLALSGNLFDPARAR